MTRKPSNLQKFPHTSKNKAEKASYFRRLRGDFDDTQNDESSQEFPETLATDPTEKVDVKKTSNRTPRAPRRSLSTKAWQALQDYGLAGLGALVLAFGTWLGYAVVEQGKDIATLQPKVERTVSDIDKLSEKYENLNSSSIKSEAVLDQVQKDLEMLKNRLLGQ